MWLLADGGRYSGISEPAHKIKIKANFQTKAVPSFKCPEMEFLMQRSLSIVVERGALNPHCNLCCTGMHDLSTFRATFWGHDHQDLKANN